MELSRDMELIVAVAETKSFSPAARALGMPISSLSRRVAELETKVRLQLLRRSTRGVELTEAGEAYFVRCRDIVAAADTAPQEQLQLRHPTGVRHARRGNALRRAKARKSRRSVIQRRHEG